MKNITGILTVDYPKLSDAQIREIELGDPETVKLPDGKTVAEYAAVVRELKDAALEEAYEESLKQFKEQDARETKAEAARHEANKPKPTPPTPPAASADTKNKPQQ
jgi:hypothetical protein